MANYSAFFTWIRQWYLFNTKNNLMWKCATAREQDEKQEKHKNFLQQKLLKK